MQIWIDADACPRDAKELVFRAANRLKIQTFLVANQPMRVPKSSFLDLVVVEQGLDVADDYIAENVAPGDLVIVEDVPLASRIVAAGAVGLTPRGMEFHENNVQTKLASRNLMADLREVGFVGGGPKPYKPKDRANFASALDRLLNRLLREAEASES